MNHYS